MAGKYNTSQHKLIIDFFLRGEKLQYTSGEVIASVCQKGKLSESTVYRWLKDMTAAGLLRKFHGQEAKGARVLYQYIGEREDCATHFHLKCVECGMLVHLECGWVNGLERHVHKTHGFHINVVQSVLYGLCGKCEHTA